MTIAADLVRLITDVGNRIALPAISHLHIPVPEPNPGRETAFGLLALADDSTGFFYTGLGDTRWQLAADIDPRRLVGRSPLEIVPWFAEPDNARKTLGLGAINAISQHVLRLSAYPLEVPASSLGAMTYTSADHVGMVGFFFPLIERLRRQGVPVTVIEQKPDLVQTDAGFRVTLDPTALATCTHVLCTASTLLNDTLHDILAHCQAGAQVALIGPTAGCLPDPLFSRGVDIIGGAVVRDLPALLRQIEQRRPWGRAVNKYSIRKTAYPGAAALAL